MARRNYWSPAFWLRAFVFIIKWLVTKCLVGVSWVGILVARLLPTKAWLPIRNGVPIVKKLDYAKAPVYIAVDSWIENEFRSREVAKEPGTVEWIEEWFKPGDVFFDIGANIGSYSLIACKHLKGQTRIYAFEPGFLTYPQLCKNIRLNEASVVISPFQVALADRTELADFHYQNLETGGALHALGDPIDQEGKEFAPVFSLSTLGYRLDDFARQFGLPKPNHVKIDVDGLEFDILQGGEDTLIHSGLRSILLEANDGHAGPGSIETWLVERGMVLHSRRDVNSLFVRTDQCRGKGSEGE
jgi:FkbM family methyltransferase